MFDRSLDLVEPAIDVTREDLKLTRERVALTLRRLCRLPPLRAGQPSTETWRPTALTPPRVPRHVRECSTRGTTTGREPRGIAREEVGVEPYARRWESIGEDRYARLNHVDRGLLRRRHKLE